MLGLPFALSLLRQDRLHLSNGQTKSFGFSLAIAFGLHYLCFAKIGCGSAKQKKILGLFFCLALTLHYLCPAKRNQTLKNQQMQDTILAISGKPGLYKLISQGRGMLIVETIDETKKRLPAGARDRVTSLNDVSMYTLEDDQPLMDIFQSIADLEGGNPTALDFKTAARTELEDFMNRVLPNWDRDRVHDSDIRKLIQWYNILVRGGYTQFADAEEAAEEAAEAAE